MLKRVITKVKGVQNTYLKYRKTDIDPNGFLLEAGQGKNQWEYVCDCQGTLYKSCVEKVQGLLGRNRRYITVCQR